MAKARPSAASDLSTISDRAVMSTAPLVVRKRIDHPSCRFFFSPRKPIQLGPDASLVWGAGAAARGRIRDARVPKLCRLLGLGFLGVSTTGALEILVEPKPCRPRRDSKEEGTPRLRARSAAEVSEGANYGLPASLRRGDAQRARSDLASSWQVLNAHDPVTKTLLAEKLVWLIQGLAIRESLEA